MPRMATSPPTPRWCWPSRSASKPRELATRIAAALARDPDVDAAEVAGPGFINLRLKPAYWHRVLRGADRGRRRPTAARRRRRARKVNVEYVSANPTGPMHVGHCRGAVVGDALANLLGIRRLRVTREYYINDAGAQVDALARSAFLRYREALGEDDRADPRGPLSRRLPDAGRRGAGGRASADAPAAMTEAEWLPIVREIAVDVMMAMIRDDLALLNVRHDVFFSERSLIERRRRPRSPTRSTGWPARA